MPDFESNGSHGFVGVILAADGTVGAPSISIASDSNTGFYRIADNRLGFTAGGVYRAVFDTNGIEVGPSASIAEEINYRGSAAPAGNVKRRVVQGLLSGGAGNTVIFTWPVPDNTTVLVVAVVIARDNTADESAAYRKEWSAQRHGGGAAVAVAGGNFADRSLEDDATWSCFWNNSGNNVQLNLTGDATNDTGYLALIKIIEFTP